MNDEAIKRQNIITKSFYGFCGLIFLAWLIRRGRQGGADD